MIDIATARIPTASASKYLQQACKHWEHNLPVLFDNMPDQITFAKDKRGVDWPTNIEVTLALEGENLVCMVNASADG